jgi:hypothetical protein
MMPLSQIDMVILLDEPKLQVCGGLQREEQGKEHRPARLYVVVRQGDVIATGSGTCDYGSKRWKVDVRVPQSRRTGLQAGPAIACGVAIVEEDPAGLEAFSWVQQVNILTEDRVWDQQEPPPIDFGDPKQAFSEQGQLNANQAIASSLTVTPSDGGRYRWAQKVEIRPVELVE